MVERRIYYLVNCDSQYLLECVVRVELSRPNHTLYNTVVRIVFIYDTVVLRKSEEYNI